ncbi:MAG: hypothetical protein K9N49_10745 [Candidatus Marinimicrobia bacterium]|nr:hypothetical protein [Candidatus Neomarinimicrobiota bacterium]
MKNGWIRFVLTGVVLVAGAAQANIITNPGGLSTAINANSLTMEEEVGNLSLAAFNALSQRYAITFETADGYPAPDAGNPASRVDRVELTGGYGQRIDFASTGYRLTSGFRPTGGSVDLVLQAGHTLTVTITNAVQGVGFTLNRVTGAAITVQLFSDLGATSQIGSDYSVAVNTGAGLSERSFFGYYDGSASIQALKIIGTGAQQHSIDDLNVAVIPEPTSLAVWLLGAALLLRVIRRR